MACGIAVKRHLELDPHHHSPDYSMKRPRTDSHCSPFPISPQLSQSIAPKSPFADVPSSLSKLSQEDIEEYVRTEVRRRRLLPVRRRLMDSASCSGDARYNERGPGSPSSGSSDSDSEGKSFRETGFASKRQPWASSGPVDIDAAASSVSASIHVSGSPSSSSTPAIGDKLVEGSEAPVFSLQQVALICARLLKDQEQSLRSEYERVLGAKLSEQYDTFVRFTNDQIHRRFEDMSISYVS